MQVTIDENKILKEILERDDDLHARIREKVRDKLISDLTDRIERKYIVSRWNGEKEIADSVLADMQEKQTELVEHVLNEFYKSYRYKKTDLTILKQLKEFLDGEWKPKEMPQRKLKK